MVLTKSFIRHHLKAMSGIKPIYYASHVYPRGTATTTNVNISANVELYLDYNCPYSAKLFKKFQDEVFPKVDNVSFTFIHVVQPWHGVQSSVLHEIGIALSKVVPEKFWEYSGLVFDLIEHWYDTEIIDMTRGDIIESVLKEVAPLVTETQLKQIRGLVSIRRSTIPDNTGNGVTGDVKYFTRYHRTRGVHMTPTVFIDGVISSNIESSTPTLEIVNLLSKL